MGRIPVMDITQQRYYKPPYTITYYDPVTQEPSYEVFPATQNLGDIYIATYGRGIYRANMNYVGIDDNPYEGRTMAGNLNLYPNPSSGSLHVGFVLENTAPSRVNIFDLAGRMVVSEDFGKLNKGKHDLLLSTASLKEGTYILQLVNGDAVYTEKIIVVK
jgi:hypothetical protein